MPSLPAREGLFLLRRQLVILVPKDSSVWLEKAEFHCRQALGIDASLPEGHVERAFLLWGPSKKTFSIWKLLRIWPCETVCLMPTPVGQNPGTFRTLWIPIVCFPFLTRSDAPGALTS